MSSYIYWLTVGLAAQYHPWHAACFHTLGYLQRRRPSLVFGGLLPASFLGLGLLVPPMFAHMGLPGFPGHFPYMDAAELASAAQLEGRDHSHGARLEVDLLSTSARKVCTEKAPRPGPGHDESRRLNKVTPGDTLPVIRIRPDRLRTSQAGAAAINRSKVTTDRCFELEPGLKSWIDSVLVPALVDQYLARQAVAGRQRMHEPSDAASGGVQ